ncbi:Hint domain-containing protein [uncultured Roseovarius sp.]|uniref:Hint domain-containing protein n=1 Tax=uncultured Roseovarius sp. TaxID=293344 RepID=UPI00260C2D27|nr:Hint domain-containing protein [uncultured Roseovarius sp.]
MQLMREKNRGTPPCELGLDADAAPVKQHRLEGSQAKQFCNRDIRAITCFTPRTGISTLNGLKAVETLEVGDRVLTRDRGFQAVRWVGQRRLSFDAIPNNPNSLPVLIRANALGPGTPERDMIVSPRHRILTTEKKLLSPMGEAEALVEASALVGQPGVMCVIPHYLTYIHVLFDQHEVILSDNLWSESFFLGRPTIEALLEDQNTAIQDIFPQIATNPETSPQQLARPCLTREHIQKLCA